MQQITIETVFIVIDIIFEVYFLVSLYKMIKLAASGEPMQPADIGIELKLENTLNIDSAMNEDIIQATEIYAVKSLPTREYVAGQQLAENKIGIVDFTVRDLLPSQFVVVDYD